MVTYSDLFQYTMVLIGLVGLFIAAWNIKRSNRSAFPLSGYNF